jgi:Ca2+-binding RTX toxin-like protein
VTGALNIELGGTTPGQFDVLDIQGNATLGGALNVTLIGGYTPTLGDSFDIVLATALGGAFDSFTGLDLGALELDVTSTATTVTLTVIASTTIDGTGGDDLLVGTAADEVLNGLAGSDTLRGAGGNDILDGGTGVDIADYSDDTGGVTVDMGLGQVSSTSVGTDTFDGIEMVRGSPFADTYNGGTPSNGELGPANIFEGGAGNDTVNGDGSTYIAFTQASTPVLVSLQLGTAQGTGIGTDTVSGILGVIGSPNDDAITGDASDNFIVGGDGVDDLDGGGGTDTLAFDAPNVVPPGGIIVDLAAGTVTDDGFGNAETILNFERVQGTSNGDQITGDAASNVLSGLAGNDTVNGGDGVDLLNGDDGNDLLVGGSGADILDGGAGDAGNDTLHGGTNPDNMTGGAGADVFLYNDIAEVETVASDQTVAASGISTDVVTDFVAGQDVFQFNSADFDSSAPFATIGVAYDGTNSGVVAGPVMVWDGTHLIYDGPGQDVAGYTVVAEVQGDAVASTDIVFV